MLRRISNPSIPPWDGRGDCGKAHIEAWSEFMAPEIIGIIGLVILFALLALGMPIAFSMILVAVGGLIALSGIQPALIVLGTSPFGTIFSYDMSVIPLFILMGEFAAASGLTADAYTAAHLWLGRLPGGLAIATIMASAGFAACSGSSVASVTVIGSMALPEMKRYKYDNALATGCVASGSTLGILIPPSIPMIVYGIMAQESVGKLFIAGIFPGVLLAGLFILFIVVMVTRNPALGPGGPKTTISQKITGLYKVWPLLTLSAIIIVGIWGGIFTTIESGGTAAFVALIIGLVRRRLDRKKIAEAIISAVRVATMIFAVMIGAFMMNYFIALTQLPRILADYVGTLPISATGVIIVILIVYVMGGCVMDVLGLMMLTLPIFIPIAKAVGYDLILFGVLTTVTVELALITPPIGMNVFILNAVTKDVPLYTIFRGAIPFIIAILIFLIILLTFPQITLYLPSVMIQR
jgi:C4-dicarboxylate transporter DctM subunit